MLSIKSGFKNAVAATIFTGALAPLSAAGDTTLHAPCFNEQHEISGIMEYDPQANDALIRIAPVRISSYGQDYQGQTPEQWQTAKGYFVTAAEGEWLGLIDLHVGSSATAVEITIFEEEFEGQIRETITCPVPSP